MIGEWDWSYFVDVEDGLLPFVRMEGAQDENQDDDVC